MPTADQPSRQLRPSRRQMLGGLTIATAGALTGAPVLASAASAASAGPPSGSRTDATGIAALEQRFETTIGLHARDLRTGRTMTHRADDRQPLCSTFKTLAAAALLHRRVDLDERVRYRDADLVDYSPVTGQHRSMTYGELCDAAIRFSDNTAGNLMLRRIGGPAGLTRQLRQWGDRISRLDRWETELNTAVPGDPRDTTTPRALAATYRWLLTGDLLPTRDRWLLNAWLEANTTSVGRFRAGLPAGWWCADKTGSGSYGVMNEAALVTAPDGTRIMVVALTRRSTTDPAATGATGLMQAVAETVLAELVDG